MHQRSIVRIGVPLAVAALALTACGSRGDSGTTSGGSTGGATKTAKIGVIAPLSGDLSALGKGIQNSVDLAVKQANENNAVPGWKLEVSAVDDEAKADVGKNAATKLAADNDVVGVVGTLNSSVASRRQPIFAAAKHRPDLPGQHQPAPDPGRGLRDAPKRHVQDVLPHLHHRRRPGPVRRAVPLRTQGIKKVATIHDKKTYGQGLVDAFTDGVQEARRQGRRGRDDQPRRRRTSTPSSPRSSPVEAAGRLLRRRVPAGRSALAADEGRRPQRPAHGWRRHLRPRSTSSSPVRPATATSPPRSAPRPTAPTSAKKFLAELQGGRLPGALRGLRRLLLRRGQRHHRRRSRPRSPSAADAEVGPSAPRSTRSARSPSTASPARSPSTSSATPRPRSSPSTRSTAASGSPSKTDDLQVVAKRPSVTSSRRHEGGLARQARPRAVRGAQCPRRSAHAAAAVAWQARTAGTGQ